MFKLFRRGLAYFIDMMVVLIIVQTISGIGFINKEIDKYNKTYNDYMEEIDVYSSFLSDINDYYKDEKLTSEEYDDLIKNNPEYEDLVDKYYKNDELTTKNYDKLVEEVNDNYLVEYKDVYYKLDKYSIVYNIAYIIVTLLYFVGFNMITGGATLGKKLVRLKIVNNKDRNNKVSGLSYLIRSILLYQIIYYLIKVLFVNLLSVGDFFNLSNIVYDIHSYLTIIILVFVMIRIDGRGLHDILSNTIVVNVDKNGNEVVGEVKEDKMVKEAEIIDEKEKIEEDDTIEEVKEIEETKKSSSSKRIKVSKKLGKEK